VKHLKVLSGLGGAPEENVPERPASGEPGLFRAPRRTEVRIFEEGNETYLFDVGSCTLISVDHLVKEIVALSASRTNDEIVAVLSKRFRTEEIVGAFAELGGLVQMGLLKDRTPTLPFRLDLDHVAEVPVTDVVLGVTDRCNLSCGYCYQADDERVGCGSMDRDVAAKVVDWLLARSGSAVSIGIKFYGGEPLLNWSLVRFVLEYATERARKNGKDVKFSLTTNGTLITDDIAAFIQRYSVGTCVSIDGPPHIHDANRRFADGRGSFAAVARGAEKLLVGSPGLVMAQATLTGCNSGRLREIVAALGGMGFGSVYVGFVHADGHRDYSMCEAHVEDLKKEYLPLLADLAGSCRLNVGGHDSVLSRLYDGRRCYHGCPSSAGINKVHVDSQGNLYPCSQLMRRDFWMGNLLTRVEVRRVNWVRERFVNDHVDVNQCRKCWARYLCGGICPARKVDGVGVGDCRAREFMALNLRLYARLWRTDEGLLHRLYGGDT
jgi:uncharacterized protein